MSATSVAGRVVHAGTYDIDPIHSRIGFAVKHLGISVVRGRFTRFEGTIEVPDDPGGLTAAAVIEAGSIDSAFPMRDQHLHTADFFDVENSRALVHLHLHLAVGRGDVPDRRRRHHPWRHHRGHPAPLSANRDGGTRLAPTA